jgi:hypothetical protein
VEPVYEAVLPLLLLTVLNKDNTREVRMLSHCLHWIGWSAWFMERRASNLVRQSAQ